VVKLIGDEVLFTARDALAACTIALKLAATFADHPIVRQCAPASQAAMCSYATRRLRTGRQPRGTRCENRRGQRGGGAPRCRCGRRNPGRADAQHQLKGIDDDAELCRLLAP